VKFVEAQVTDIDCKNRYKRWIPSPASLDSRHRSLSDTWVCCVWRHSGAIFEVSLL